MAIRRLSTARPGVKSNQFWDQDTAQGAMEPIASSRLGFGAIEFNNIPQTYRDLMIVIQARGTNAGTDEFLLGQFNNTFSGHSWTYLGADGSSVFTNRNSPGGISPSYFYLGLMPGGNSAAGLFSSTTMHIVNYTSTSANKTILWRFSSERNGSGQTAAGVALFSSTSAITRALFLGSNGTNGVATLYGIKDGV